LGAEMGKIYFNEETGEFWESSFHRRKPPKGFNFTGYFMNYNYKPRTYVAKSYYCPKCKKYHAVISLYTHELPVYKRMLIVFGEKYGCKEAVKLIGYGERLGGTTKHYNLICHLKDVEINLDKWIPIIANLKGSLRKKIINLLLSGKENEAETIIIARKLR